MLVLSLHLLCLSAALSCQNPLNPRLVPAGRGGSFVVAQDTVLAERDTYISKTLPNQNFGSSDTLRTGGPNRNRALLAFDSTAIAQAVGSGQLDSAWLELTIVLTDGLGASGRTFDLHRLLSNWTELGATWNCPVDANTGNESPDCSGSSWDMTNGNAYASSNTARVTVVDQQTGVLRLNVTSDVAGFLSGTANYGWLFRKTNESLSGGTVTFSRNNPGTGPRLVLSTTQDTARPPIPPTQWPATPLLAPWPGDTQNVYYRNLVGIVFDTSASGVVINEVLRRYQATIIGGFAPPNGTGEYYVQIPDPGPTLASLDSIVLRVSQEPGVAEAYHLSYRLRVDFRGRYPSDGLFARKADWFRNQAPVGTAPRLAINAPLSWGCEQGISGMSRVRLGILDATFESTHPDLDQANTHSFPFPQTVFLDDPDLQQDAWARAHGTGVAGVLAAVGDNQIGVAGMVWSADLNLYPYGAGTTLASSLERRFQEALTDAASSATRVVMTAFSFGQGTDTLVVRKLKKALEFYLADPRALFVYAAGNDSLRLTLAQVASPSDPRVTALDRAVAELYSTRGSQILVVTGSSRDSLWETTGSVGGKPEDSNLWFGATDLAAPADFVLSLGRTTEPQSDFDVGTRVFEGTSFAAPFVAGVAAQLLTMDPSLTGAQVKDYIVRGSTVPLVNASSVHLLDAYGALTLLARERPGTPLCGNRVWAEGKVIYAQRASGPEPLYTANDTLGLLNPYHGGRRIDFVENGVGDGAIIYQNGSWTPVSDPQSLPPGLANATWNSLFGMPHDGDSLATSTQTASTGGVTVTVRYGTPFAAGRTIGTLPVPLLASTTTTCGTMIAQHDTTGAFTGYQCTGQIPDGSFETASSRTTVPPMGGRIFLLVNRFHTQSLGVTDSLLCPGFGYDPFGNMNCYNRVVTYDQTSQRAELYELPIQGGSATLKWSRNQQTLHWLGLSETGSEAVGATSQFVAGVPTGCRIEYLDPATGTAVGATIPNPVACSARGTGGIADIRMASVRLPLDSPPKPRHWR